MISPLSRRLLTAALTTHCETAADVVRLCRGIAPEIIGSIRTSTRDDAVDSAIGQLIGRGYARMLTEHLMAVITDPDSIQAAAEEFGILAPRSQWWTPEAVERTVAEAVARGLDRPYPIAPLRICRAVADRVGVDYTRDSRAWLAESIRAANRAETSGPIEAWELWFVAARSAAAPPPPPPPQPVEVVHTFRVEVAPAPAPAPAPADLYMALYQFLLAAFSPDEIKRALRSTSWGARVVQNVRSPASPSQVAADVVAYVQQDERVPNLLDLLRRERPRRVAEINAIESAYRGAR